MDKIFGMDSGFYRFMNKVADLIILNLLCLICCIPIVTIGASVTAMYTVMLKIARNEESYTVRGFFKAFKANFRQSTIIWLIFAVVGVILWLDMWLCNKIDHPILNALWYIFLFLSFVYLMMVLYVFPIQSRFVNTIKNTIKNSLIMAIAQLPWTILIILCHAAVFILIYVQPGWFFYILAYLLLMGTSLPAFGSSYIFNRVFKKFMPKEEEEDIKELPAE